MAVHKREMLCVYDVRRDDKEFRFLFFFQTSNRKKKKEKGGVKNDVLLDDARKRTSVFVARIAGYF